MIKQLNTLEAALIHIQGILNLQVSKHYGASECFDDARLYAYNARGLIEDVYKTLKNEDINT